MKHALTLLALAAASFAAHATYCPDGSLIESHPAGNCSATNTPAPGMTRAQAQSDASARAAAGAVSGSTSSANGSQRQQQAQQQGQRQDVSAGNGNSTGQAVTIQGAQAGSGDAYTDRSVAVAWAPIIPAPAAPGLATANMVMVPGTCGPRHSFIRQDVHGRKFNSVGADESFAVGTNDVLYPEDVPFIERGGYLIGSQITEIHAVPGTSAAGGFSIGAFSKGDGIQGGANGSSSVQQVTTRYTIKDCIYAAPRPVVEVRTVYVDRPAPARRVVKPRPRPAAPCVPAANVCKVQP